MKKILLIGTNSFIGKNFLSYSKYRDVRTISLFEIKPEDINFSEIDVVVHLAAIVHQSKRIPEREYFRVNRDLCLKVADYAKKGGVKQFIFLSTFKVYGDIDYSSVVINETTPCFPTTAYERSKHEAELGLIKMEEPGFTVSIIRTPLVYGQGVKANMLSLLRVVDKFPILPFGSMKNRRCYTFVENLVGFIDRITEIRAPGIFIARDDKALSTTELVQYISKYSEKKVYLFRLPGIFLKIVAFLLPGVFNRLFGSYESDNHKTLEILNFRPAYSSEEGIKKMVLSYKKMKEDKRNKSVNI